MATDLLHVDLSNLGKAYPFKQPSTQPYAPRSKPDSGTQTLPSTKDQSRKSTTELSYPPLPIRAFIGGYSVPFRSIDDKFEALAEAWQAHNLGQSITDYDHLSYLQIIGMGPPAVPLLMSRLSDGEAEWIFALKCIVGNEAESRAMRGDVDSLLDAWLKWGMRYGQICREG